MSLSRMSWHGTPMFFSVRRYSPAHFHVWSNIFPWSFRTYSSEAISSALVRSAIAQSLASRIFSRSHSFSSSLVARFGMRSASSSGERGVLPSLVAVIVVTFFLFASGFFLFLPRFSPALLQRLGLPTPCCAQRRGRFQQLWFSHALPQFSECFRFLGRWRRRADTQEHPQHRAGFPT